MGFGMQDRVFGLSPLNPCSWPSFRERHSEQIQWTEKISVLDDELCQKDRAFEEQDSQA